MGWIVGGWLVWGVFLTGYSGWICFAINRMGPLDYERPHRYRAVSIKAQARAASSLWLRLDPSPRALLPCQVYLALATITG
jgi:hypothetical protein